MTALTLSAPKGFHLGGLELRRYTQQFMMTGLGVSLLLHALVISSYFAASYLAGSNAVNIQRSLYVDIISLGPPPSIAPIDIGRLIKVKLPELPVRIAAIPKPVLDKIAPLDPVIPTQNDLSKILDHNADSLLNPGSGVGVTIRDIPADDAIPPIGTFIPREQEPILAVQVTPEYPPMARTAAVGGYVQVKFWVDKNGSVKRPEVVKAEPKGLGFEEAAIAAVSQWKYTPALQGNRPVGVWIVQRIRFVSK